MLYSDRYTKTLHSICPHLKMALLMRRNNEIEWVSSSAPFVITLAADIAVRLISNGGARSARGEEQRIQPPACLLLRRRRHGDAPLLGPEECQIHHLTTTRKPIHRATGSAFTAHKIHSIANAFDRKLIDWKILRPHVPFYKINGRAARKITVTNVSIQRMTCYILFTLPFFKTISFQFKLLIVLCVAADCYFLL